MDGHRRKSMQEFQVQPGDFDKIFEVHVEIDGIMSQEQADRLERRTIAAYDAIRKGYNKMKGPPRRQGYMIGRK
ncbi:hypothetical protein DUNSADRAFT_13647 [Dunaliella salina]|uniref:Uncharacterized protein n=1 Tax=Dunaliella salina TaxID=3046 RepID=A0ABQ7G8X7_DUNSA|nr:hypothetical protein DUNSADRAFT_13647 [Dunaliella salina]|eukprot:KAF5831060.1 hypothetical protein DUNSADRAFT_13647 [Dunaliella salina]